MSAGCPGQRGGAVEKGAVEQGEYVAGVWRGGGGWLLEGVGGGAKGLLHIVFCV